jgi:TRAP transporter TAXI family solute receptor
MRHPVQLFGVALAMATATTAAALAQSQPSRVDVTIATATPTGTYFATGNALCRLLQRAGIELDTGDVTRAACGTSATAGSNQNIELLRSREADFALVQSDIVDAAWSGTGTYAGRRLDSLRTILTLNREAFQVFAGRSSNIRAWGDLKGRKISLGLPGTTGHGLFLDLLKVHGHDIIWLGDRLELPVGAQPQELCEGNIEAFGQTTAWPNTNLTAAARCGAMLVPLDTPQIASWLTTKPSFTRISLPRATYPGQMEDVTTIGVLASLMTTTNASEAIVYSLTRVIFEGLDDLKAMLPVMRDLDPQSMINVGHVAPLHPGAARYLRERGWTQKTLEPIPAIAPPAAASAQLPLATPPAVPPTKPAARPTRTPRS